MALVADSSNGRGWQQCVMAAAMAKMGKGKNDCHSRSINCSSDSGRDGQWQRMAAGMGESNVMGDSDGQQ